MPRSHTKLVLVLVLVLFAVAALGAASATAARDRSAARAPKLQRGLDRVVAAGVPGAVLVVRDGDRTIRLTSGNSNLRPKTAMRAGDRFRVGSITKTFVATVALQLVAEQKLTLQDTVARWLPGVVPNGEHITVRQLLNHTSGLFAFGVDRDFVAQAFLGPHRRQPRICGRRAQQPGWQAPDRRPRQRDGALRRRVLRPPSARAVDRVIHTANCR